MAKTYAFTLKNDDTDLAEALANLPKRQRSSWIRDALRSHLAAQSCDAPNLLHQVLDRLGAIEINISNIGHAPLPEPTKELWDEEIDGVLLDIDI